MLQLSSGPWVLLCHESILRITYLRVYLAFVTFSPSKRRMFRNRLGVVLRIGMPCGLRLMCRLVPLLKVSWARNVELSGPGCPPLWVCWIDDLHTWRFFVD